MQSQNCPSHNALLGAEVQSQSDAQLHKKRALTHQPSPSPGSLLLQSEPTSLRIRTCRVRKGEDKMLYCQACGRQIPTTPQGTLDIEKLAHEIALQRLLSPSCQECQPPYYK